MQCETQRSHGEEVSKKHKKKTRKMKEANWVNQEWEPKYPDITITNIKTGDDMVLTWKTTPKPEIKLLPPRYPSCPRCHSVWKQVESEKHEAIGEYRCTGGCGIIVYEDNRQYHLASERVMGRFGDYLIIWDVTNQKCHMMIGDVSEIIKWNQDERPIQLPWIDFDKISTEKLKIYVLFS